MTPRWGCGYPACRQRLCSHLGLVRFTLGLGVHAEVSCTRDAYLNQRGSVFVEFQFADVMMKDTTQRITAPQARINFDAVDRSGKAGTDSPFLLWGNLASVDVTAGGCTVSSDGIATPGSSTTGVVGPPANLIPVFMTAPANPGSSCTVSLTPLLPSDGTGSPLVPATARSFVVPIGP
jgi:hypothetical protein